MRFAAALLAVGRLVSATAVLGAGFTNVRVDHQVPPYQCIRTALALWEPDTSPPTVYVAFERYEGISALDVMFQKSTNGGRTWLPEDVLIWHSASHIAFPDIVVDDRGYIYVTFSQSSTEALCVRSTDGGVSWSGPVRMDDDTVGALAGRPTVTADSSGTLFSAWRDDRTDTSEVWCSISTDQGMTWRANTRVTHDTILRRTHHKPYVCVQPGTGRYLIAAAEDIPHEPYDYTWSFLYQSTDCGLTWGSGVRFDTMDENEVPSVVADEAHIVCVNSGSLWDSSRFTTYSRALYCEPDSWGPAVKVVDTTAYSPYDRPALAMSSDGRVHLAQMVRYEPHDWTYDVHYYVSTDYGATWSHDEVVNEDTTTGWHHCCPDVAVGRDGSVYVAWYQVIDSRGCWIWFATNRALPLEESSEPQTQACGLRATVARTLTPGAATFDVTGRRVENPKPGVYFVREAQAQAQAQAVRKVIVTR